MMLFKTIYKMFESSTGEEWSAQIVATSPQEVREYLEKNYGELTYFRIDNRTNIDLIVPSIERSHYLKYKRLNDDK